MATFLSSIALPVALCAVAVVLMPGLLPDALAGVAAIRRHRHHHACDLGAGSLAAKKPDFT
ncbi:hypothetical protein [Rhodopseudomonas sp. WA056]|uniref:hypothetical protein n=1 Tax=Rhodopseudomonas sp. WA056 TaxID=2269367 RepID=UPI0013DE7F95|nr:hypothetical protein [Rhodopseudomonas sp. WA056]